MNDKSYKHSWPIIIFTLNLFLGLIFCFLISPRLIGTGVTLLDPDGYGTAGRFLYESGRFDLIEKAPLYPSFVALVSLLSGGYNIQAIQVAQCLLAALTCVLLYFTFTRTIGEISALTAALICALYPILIWYTPRLWTEVLLTFLLAAYTLALVNLLQKPTAVNALICGVVLGFAALAKGITLVYLILTPLALIIRFRKDSWRWVLISGLAAAVLILPWTWRNWQMTGQLIPIHTGGGYNFYLGNSFVRHWSEAPLSYTSLRAYAAQEVEHHNVVLGNSSLDTLSRDKILLSAALQEIRQMPSLTLRKIVLQSLSFWYLAADPLKSILTGILQIPILLVALFGLIKAIRLRSWALALLLPVLGITLASVFIFAFARLSAPVMPYLIGLAVFGLSPVRRRADLESPIPVLQAITRLIVGGAQETVMYLADLLDKDRFQVEVLSGPQTGSEGSLIEELCARSIPLTILPDMRREVSPLHDILAVLKMSRFIANNRYTIVHTNSSKAGIVGRLAARMAGTPLIVHTVHGWSFHDQMATWHKRLYITLERLAASFSDAMVAVTVRDIEKGLQVGIGRPEQFHLIRSAIPMEEFDPSSVNHLAVREQLGIPLEAPVLGNVGRFSPQKNPLDWVNVAALVAKQMPECYFLLVGDGPLRAEVEALIAEKNLSGHTILTGLRRDVPEMLSVIDVFLLTSLWEGLPRVIPQAMAMQVPVVANNVDGCTEAIVHGETGFLCSPGDLEDLAAHCLKLLGDERLRAEMGQRGRVYAIQEFDVHRMVQQMAALYEELLESHSI